MGIKRWRTARKEKTAEQQKKYFRKKMILSSVGVFLLLCGVVTGGLTYGYQVWKSMYKPLPDAPVVNTQSSALQTEPPLAFAQGKQPEMNLIKPAAIPPKYRDQYTNILLILSDGFGACDLMLLTIDQAHEQLKLTSFLKEIWVKIPGLDRESRLDAAYAAGGAKLAAQTLEQNFGVTIDRYIEVDFQQLPDLIDRLDGVELTISQAEAEYINEYSASTPTLPGAGTYNLNGRQALCHAQNRTVEVHDFDAVNRVRDVVMAAFVRFQTTSDMMRLAKLVNDSTSMLSTDLELEEFQKLLLGCFDYVDYETCQYLLPCGDGYVKTTVKGAKGTQDVLLIRDIDQVRERIYRFVYGDYHSSGVCQPDDPLYNP
ncbi:MAG: hypothetical protein HFE39_01195 [Clostridiales bacterium]|jgi:LCP family protein required for cell wall assembly|nr:hypothetical protein [Clostridiales bacterium]